jgi:creatinine amidohydrolase/Fe(II)-dependent formamide hydrolase-like protein
VKIALSLSWLCLVALAFCTFAHQASAQIYKLAEMNAEQIAALDRSRTAVILTGGILEQHGPHLPSFSDGYLNEWYAEGLAERIVARPGWKVLRFPTIPLGSGGANEIGRQFVAPGTYAVRSSTLRAIFMDLATDFGEQGFKWIFVVHAHGAPRHNRVIDQAGEYFRDTYGGRMVHLMGLNLPDEPSPDAPPTSDEEKREDAVAAHGGAWETSALLFLRPDLVGPIANLAPQTAATPPDIHRVATAPGWPGYIGSPRWATAARGAHSNAKWLRIHATFALKILDGADERDAPRYGSEQPAGPEDVALDQAVLSREEEIERKQQAWLKAHRMTIK